MSAKKGGIEYLSAIMLICLTGIIFLYSISVKEIKQYQHMAKDSLDSSCLAAALIDMDEYSLGNGIIIKDYYRLRDIFCDSLKVNMKLDSNYNPSPESIYGRVTIHAFNVYYIAGGKLYSYIGEGAGTYELRITPYSGTERTPGGQAIESGTIYADIGMNVRTYFDIEEYVHVTSGVDIVEN